MRPAAQRLAERSNVLAVVAIAVILFGVAQLFAGGLETGLETDEPIHQDRAAAWLDDGWYVPSYWKTEDGEPDPESEYSTPWVYGPAFQAVAHVANVALGKEPLNYVEHTPGAYKVRHMTIALIALLAVAAVGGAVWRLTRSPTFGLWTAAAMLAVPRFLGQAFFNPKDIPAASGYTLLVVALLFALLEKPGKANPRRTLGIAAAVAFGIAIGAGTRLALWLPFAIAIGSYAVLRLGQSRLGGIARDKGTDVAIGAAAVLGFVAIAALYPNISSTPLTLLRESVSDSANFPNLGDTLTVGSMLSVPHPPAWYIPAWLGFTYPLLLGALALLGAGAGVWALARARGKVWGMRELALLLVLEQALMLPLAVILKGSPAYNGIRQHLYVMPALTILAGYGAWWFLQWARSRDFPRLWNPFAVGALCLALVMPMAAQTILFPFNYTYFNPLAAITGGVNGRWEIDYRWTSLRQGLAKIPEDVEYRCAPYLVSREADSPEDIDVDFDSCSGDRIDLAELDRATDVAPGALEGPPKVWVLGRNREGRTPPPYCEQFDNVTRWLWGESVTISYVLRCDPAAIAREERRDERERAEADTD